VSDKTSIPETNVDADTLRITEIFVSLQGESTYAGCPTVFVRTTGCPLRCVYCDTTYAFSGGKLMPLSDIVTTVQQYQVQHVTVTGGEPLAQPATHALLEMLCNHGYLVSLETSGAIDVSSVDRRVKKVVDIKTPGSGEMEHNLLHNLNAIAKTDELKFVIADRVDYEWSRQFVAERDIDATVLFSPVHETLDARELADWVVADRLAVRFQMQLHKYLWGNEPGR
jgi:7-carboxy-7-deazaguanine synthase